MKKVTLAIPTYNRPQYLRRALESAVQQNYPNLEILVSDNNTEGQEVEQIISEFQNRHSDLKFFKQKKNIGAINNFLFLLQKASGEYFMWLADDDEITNNCVSHLAATLDADISVSCVAPNWYLLSSIDAGTIMPRRNYVEAHWLSRALKYIWSSNDAFFYGMFHTEQLIKARFYHYCWPNRNQISNWAYPYLYDIILTGKIIVTSDESVKFINHSYVDKSYQKNNRGVVNFVKSLCRRANVYGIYIYKTFTRKPFFVSTPVILVSIASFIRDLYRYVAIKTSKIFKSSNTDESYRKAGE